MNECRLCAIRNRLSYCFLYFYSSYFMREEEEEEDDDVMATTYDARVVAYAPLARYARHSNCRGRRDGPRASKVPAQNSVMCAVSV